MWSELSAAQQAQYHDLKRRYDDKRNALDEKQGRRRAPSRSTSAADDVREAEHRKLNEEEQQAIAALRRKFEREVRRHQAQAGAR